MPPGPHLAWTPDSRWLVCVTPGRLDSFLSLVAVDSTEKRILTRPSLTGLGDRAPAVSLDGGTAIFSRGQGRTTYDLYKLRLTGEYVPNGEPVKAPSVTHPNLGAAWLPDGTGLVFASNWHGENGLWRTSAFSDGKPARLSFAPTGQLNRRSLVGGTDWLHGIPTRYQYLAPRLGRGPVVGRVCRSR
jgi:Tol biopolymer transport system component